MLGGWNDRQLRDGVQELDLLNQASALELGGYLTNTLLRDTDVMSMAHGLEVRVPLLDHLLIERVLQIPGSDEAW
jgi:asparagine synthase (glutamine-hydrolysing)